MLQSILDIENLSVALQFNRKASPVKIGDISAASEEPASNNTTVAVDRINIRLNAGETLCIVGESGSGKTVTALSILRLIEFRGGQILSGHIGFEGKNLAALSQNEMNDLRGRRIGIVFQDAMSSLDPVITIGEQIGEVLRRHKGISKTESRQAAVELLKRVHIADPQIRVDQYPHQLSGGMKQRAMIAMAIACSPLLLIADEPTTALDVTLQAQILLLLRELQNETGMGVLLITHDLGIAARIADRVMVMYAGRFVENASARKLFREPSHPYTQGLLMSIVNGGMNKATRLASIPGSIPGLANLPAGCRFHPRCSRAVERCSFDAPPLVHSRDSQVACWNPVDSIWPEHMPFEQRVTDMPSVLEEPSRIIEASDLYKDYLISGAFYQSQSKSVRVIDGLSFHIEKGETFGLVGESGCGKSTLGRLLLQMEKATSGRVMFDGKDLTKFTREELRRARRDMQMVFQDPYGSIDPRWTIGSIIGEPFAVHVKLRPKERLERVRNLLSEVGLDPNIYSQYPHLLSGGQRQRVAIARTIALRPRFIVADEALSALDASVQAQIINLLQDLKEKLSLTYLFISHGLQVVRHISDRTGVMYLGRLVETGPTESLFRRPAHPYTKSLISSDAEQISGKHKGFVPILGEIPSISRPPAGCRFHPRCFMATARCREENPPLIQIEKNRSVACHFPL